MEALDARRRMSAGVPAAVAASECRDRSARVFLYNHKISRPSWDKGYKSVACSCSSFANFYVQSVAGIGGAGLSSVALGG